MDFSIAGTIWRTTSSTLTKPIPHPDRTEKWTSTRISRVSWADPYDRLPGQADLTNDGSQTEERRLVFVPVAYTQDDETACHDKTVLDQMGTTSLKLNYGRIGAVIGDEYKYAAALGNQGPLLGAPEEETKKAKRVG